MVGVITRVTVVSSEAPGATGQLEAEATERNGRRQDSPEPPETEADEAESLAEVLDAEDEAASVVVDAGAVVVVSVVVDAAALVVVSAAAEVVVVVVAAGAEVVVVVLYPCKPSALRTRDGGSSNTRSVGTRLTRRQHSSSSQRRRGSSSS